MIGKPFESVERVKNMTASAVSQANLGKRWLESLRNQFRRPAGLIGRLVGWWMNLDNASMNETAVKLLDVGQQDSVLGQTKGTHPFFN